MVKKFVLFIIAFILMSNVIFSVEAKNIEQSSEWAKEEIDEAINLGFVLEELQGDYKENITREEFAATAVKFLAYEYNLTVEDMMNLWCKKHTDENGIPMEISHSFDEDLKGSNFAYYVRCADTLGIVKGRGDGIFDPFSNITREEAAVMLHRTFSIYSQSAIKLNHKVAEIDLFNDCKQISSWANSAIGYMYQLDVMKGTSAETYEPKSYYTREQCYATFLRLDRSIGGRGSGAAPYFMSYQEMVEEIENRAYYESWYKEENENYIIMYGQQAPGGRMNAKSFYIIYKNGGRKNIVNQFGLVDLKLSLSNFEFDESGHFLYCVRHEAEGGQRYMIDLQKAMVEIIDN